MEKRGSCLYQNGKNKGSCLYQKGKIRGHVYTRQVENVTHDFGTSVLTATVKDAPPLPVEVDAIQPAP